MNDLDCPDCGGELQHQNEVAVQCLDVDEHSFGHYIGFDGADILIDSEGRVERYDS